MISSGCHGKTRQEKANAGRQHPLGQDARRQNRAGDQTDRQGTCFAGPDRVSAIVSGLPQTQTLCTDMRPPPPLRPIGEMPVGGCYTGTRAPIQPSYLPCPFSHPCREAAPHNVLLRRLGWALSDGLGIRREYAQASTGTRAQKVAPPSSLHFTLSRAPSLQTVGPKPLGLDPGINQIGTPASVLILGAGGARHLHHHHQHLILPTA